MLPAALIARKLVELLDEAVRQLGPAAKSAPLTKRAKLKG
jgi:hypothetical protein